MIQLVISVQLNSLYRFHTSILLRSIQTLNRTFCLEVILLGCYFYRISILAFHEALVRQPRDPLVVATFALAVYLGGDLPLAVDIGQSINRQHDAGFSELLEPQVRGKKRLLAEVKDLAISMRQALTEMTDEYYVANAM